LETFPGRAIPVYPLSEPSELGTEAPSEEGLRHIYNLVGCTAD